MSGVKGSHCREYLAYLEYRSEHRLLETRNVDSGRKLISNQSAAPNQYSAVLPETVFAHITMKTSLTQTSAYCTSPNGADCSCCLNGDIRIEQCGVFTSWS
jgi:hypothetical protein